MQPNFSGFFASLYRDTRQRPEGALTIRRLAMALYTVGLIVALLALASKSPVLGASVVMLAGTVGDIRVSTSKIANKSCVLRRTLCRLGAQIIALALVLLDIGGLGFVLAAPVWLAPWMIINLTALVLWLVRWRQNRRIQSESATAMQRQAEEAHAMERRNLEEREREALRKQQAEQAERLRQAEEQLREVEQRRRQEEQEREAQRKQQVEQAERLRETEQLLRDVEQRRRQEEEEREAQRKQQIEQAERLRKAEQLLRDGEQRRRQEEEEREAQRKRQRERKHAGAQSQADWWIVLGVAPTASKDEIARSYRHKIKQCHPDRVIGLAPEFLDLAEERTKALNEAYANAMRTRWQRAA
jgi:hypothetical protein